MIGRTLGHYRILEEIGKGGMGVVYRARDERLDRDVAVKVLPAGTLADEAARQRFRKEALALSRLNHPNIQTVHDFDTQDGLDFLVTEYVPGVTLNERLAGQGLPEKEVLRLGQQLAEGLAAAHDQGIIHRDLKPSNLRITLDARLKILDFGVAKLLGPVSATAATETGTQTLAGTPLYMSPEQRRGERVDARSDLYSAGLVLWEMATGKPPVVAGRGLSGRTSPELQRIVEKCLEEEPENRYQSARELAVDLRRLGAPALEVPRRQVPPGSARRVAVGLGAMAVAAAALVAFNVGGLRERLFSAGAPKIDSLAVLPLKNLMGDPAQDYFVEGMHEALTAELSKISALKVISRTSTVRYKDTDKPMPQIARELGVAGLIEGSVLREGDQVRITVQLIHGPTDKHLWAQSFDRELRGILALQSEVARAIAREVKLAVTPAEATRLASTHPVNPEAHRHYLLGRYHWNKRTPEGFQKAAEHFQQAVDLDPTYALAYAGLADNYVVQPAFGTLAPREAYPRAKAAAQRALEIDDSLAEPYAVLGLVLAEHEWDWEGAEQAFRRALDRNPNYATAHQWYAEYLSYVGRHEESIAEIKRAQELDPLSVIIAAIAALMNYYARQYDEALEAIRKAMEMDPSWPNGYGILGWIYLATDRPEEAIAVFHRQQELSPRAWVSLALANAAAGKREEAWRSLKQLEGESKERNVSAAAIALIYAHLGQRDRAFYWLEKSLEQRDWQALLMKVDPRFDILRDDPRFQALLRRMNFPSP